MHDRVKRKNRKSIHKNTDSGLKGGDSDLGTPNDIIQEGSDSNGQTSTGVPDAEWKIIVVVASKTRRELAVTLRGPATLHAFLQY